MLESLQPIINWLHVHPHLAGLATFFISLAESLVIIGLIIPGSVTMTAIGTLIGAGILPGWLTMLWAIAGAVAGDSASYWIGHHYHEHMREIWPFSRYPQILKKGEVFFKNHGGKSVFLGRFVGPIRPIIPVIAGMMNMQPSRFLLANITSAIGWAPTYMLPGMLLGAASLKLPPETATRFLGVIAAIVIILWCISWLINLITARIIKFVDKLLDSLWQYIAQHPRLSPIASAFRDPAYPQSHRQLSTALFFIISSSLFLCLALSVKHHGIMTNLNIPLFHFFRSLHNLFLDHFMVGITFLGESPVIAVLFSVLLMTFIIRKQWHLAFHWLLLMLLCFSLPEIFKHWVQAARPSGLLQSPSGWSFPSGHVSLSTAFYGFFAVILAKEMPRGYRWIVYAPTCLLVMLIAFSRLYLGAHWLSDVLGGILLGLSCVLIITLLFRRKIISKINILSTLLIAFIGLSITWLWYFNHQYQRAIYNYTPYWPETTIAADAWWQSGNSDVVPLYRKNRLGKPIQLLNIEWTGDLLNIERNLEQHGWIEIPKFNILNAIDNLVGKNRDQQFPFFRELYDDRNPILVMIKRIEKPKALIVLRLWDPKITLSNNRTPLWVGTVTYYKPWKFNFLKYRKNLSDASTLLPAQHVLIQSLSAFEWKKIQRPLVADLADQSNGNGKGTILLIRAKSMNNNKK